MIRWKCVLCSLGKILSIAGTAMILPLIWSICSGDGMLFNFGTAIFLYFITGGILSRVFRNNSKIHSRESFLIVSLGWLIVSLIGAIPYYMSGFWDGYISSFFETISGFTTTGASVIEYPEKLPESILLWRSMTQWLGGLGVVVLFVALLTQTDNGGLQMLRAELSGPFNDKINPKTRSSAAWMWQIYTVLTIVLIFFLLLGGLDFTEAFCYGFSTISTGGFSISSHGIAALDNTYIELVILIFMFIGGISFPLLYRVVSGHSLKYFIKNEEFGVYGIFVIVTSLIIFIDLSIHNYSSYGNMIIDSLFQTVSQLTTTGYATADYTYWPSGSAMLMVCLMMIGASYSSTSGSLKMGSYVLIFKSLRVQLFKMIHPNAVLDVRINGKIVKESVVMKVFQMMLLFYIITFIGGVIMAFCSNLPLTEALTASMATISNNGQAVGSIGPSGNYGSVNSFGLLVLSGLMLLGRLEIYTVLICFSRAFWQK